METHQHVGLDHNATPTITVITPAPHSQLVDGRVALQLLEEEEQAATSAGGHQNSRVASPPAQGDVDDEDEAPVVSQRAHDEIEARNLRILEEYTTQVDGECFPQALVDQGDNASPFPSNFTF